jgi:alpha-1,2-mannosyltransferase
MERAYDMLRTGAWLTRERVLLVATTILVASAAGFLYLVVTANGLVDQQGRPLGTDFSSFYAAGTYVLDGKAAAPFDLAQQHAREQQMFGAGTPFYSWFYPPLFLFIAGALALMPYGLALAVWQAATFALYLLVMWAIVSLLPSPLRGGSNGQRPFGVGVAEQKFDPTPLPPPLAAATSPTREVTRLRLLLALAFPAVLINVGHGQNGFLTAALLGGALVQLQRRPIAAGVLFGLLAYKPQFALMIPLALAAGGRWRAFAAATATVAALAIATTLAFGWQVWPAFLDSTRFARQVALEQGDTGWYKIQSVFAWARMWGAPVPLAYAIQGALTAALGAALIVLWRGATAYPLQAAALCLAALLATPFSFDYDMMVLAPAIAFLVADGQMRGFGAWEKTALAALWLVPLAARSVAHATLIPLGVPAMLAAFVLLLRRSTFRFDLPMAFSGRFLLK